MPSNAGRYRRGYRYSPPRSRNNKIDTYVAINAPLSGASVASDLAVALHGVFPGYFMRGRYESRSVTCRAICSKPGFNMEQRFRSSGARMPLPSGSCSYNRTASLLALYLHWPPLSPKRCTPLD